MLLISDANVFIDFDCCGLLPGLFSLSDEIAVPDVLYHEELEQRHPELIALGLILMKVTEAGVAYVEKLQMEFDEPGINDLLALSLAREQSCPLITGDRNLRHVAKREKVDLKGTLWVMRRMIEQEIVEISQAKSAFETMREKKRRLPWAKARQMLGEFES